MKFSLVKYGEDVMTVRTRCRMCMQSHDMEVPTEGIDKVLLYNAKVQDAFPNLSADDRERLISGTCPTCWNTMFAEREE